MKMSTAEIRPIVSSRGTDLTESLRYHDGYGNENLKNGNKDHSSHAAHFSVHFITITERLGRDNN